MFDTCLCRFRLRIPVLLFLLVQCGTSFAELRVANFDGFSEGFLSTTFQDGGITFFGGKLSASGPDMAFAIDTKGQLLFDQSGGILSASNVLLVSALVRGVDSGSFINGPSEFSIDPGGLSDSISIGAFFIHSDDGHLVTLEVLRQGSVVASTSVDLSTFKNYHLLSINGVNFDRARVYAHGAVPRSTYIGAYDSVRIHVVPELSSGVLAECCLTATFSMMRKR